MPKTIIVPDTRYGGTTTAEVSSDKPDSWVFVQCYQDDRYVYAAYFPVIDGTSECGPLASSIWPGGPADGVASHGWFTGRGFGEWHEIATTTFQVTG